MSNKTVKAVLADQQTWDSTTSGLSGKKGVDLLKAIEGATRSIVKDSISFESDRNLLGVSVEQQQRLLKAVLDQQWPGIPEYSEEFFKVYSAASRRQQFTRAYVRKALETLDHGFSAFDRNLLRYASLVNDAYDVWYQAWAKAVQGNATAKRLAQDDKEGKVPKAMYNHYTIISMTSDGEYTQASYATYFPAEIGSIVSIFDEWIAEMSKVEAEDAAVKADYLDYLKQYRTCLAETDIDRLEDEWRILDEKWMRIRYWIQIVHDIEYGYGDPLRCKVSPEFSIRLQDQDYAAENATISKIQDVMVDYFHKREGPLAKAGIGALKKSLAAIYYLPFQCGVNLYFRFSGQSVPNRSEVRQAEGVKIYFDPVSTAAREESARDLASKVLADPARKDSINTVGTIVWHVAAHEIGHAIYGLDAVKDAIKVSTKTLLEEPRAELTALHTMRLLLPAGLLTEADVAGAVASFMLQDLRRFQMFDSSATRPYTVSAMACWKRASDLGYITLDASNKVTIDDSKVLVFLAESSKVFETILDAEDRSDGATIEKVLADMEAAETAPIVAHLINELFTKERSN
ncbi:g10421 [Coccomyxa elongata]